LCLYSGEIISSTLTYVGQERVSRSQPRSHPKGQGPSVLKFKTFDDTGMKEYNNTRGGVACF